MARDERFMNITFLGLTASHQCRFSRMFFGFLLQERYDMSL
jgi:hypothetical protein